MEDINETVIYYGEPIKLLDDGGRVGGYLVRFSGPADTDLEGDFFTRDTDFDIEDGAERSVYYHRGYDGTLKSRKLGRGALKIDDIGVWIEAQLQLRDEYEQFIYDEIEAGRMGWSSGAVAHLVDAEQVGKSTWIKSWPIGEASITPTPAEYRNTVLPLKSILSGGVENDEAETKAESLSVEATQIETETINNDSTNTQEVKIMTEEIKTEEGAPGDNGYANLEQQVNDMSKAINSLLDHMQNEPAIRKSGYFTEDGGAADKEVKSFGDWLMAVRRKDHDRLTKVYHSVKDISGDAGTSGGYLVPDEFSAVLLQVAMEQSRILAAVRTVPVGAPSGSYPALDQYVAPTAGAGNTALAGNLVATGANEGATLTETQPTFVEIQWRAKKLGGYVEVTNEMIVDSPQAIEALLSSLFQVAIASKKERHILRGSGNDNEYLGILTSDAAIGITPDNNNVFAYADALEMWSRFKPVGGSPVWLIHPGIIPDIGVFQIGTAGAGVPGNVGQAGQFGMMPGTPYPILISEHLPQDDNSGCVILADLSAYLVFQRNGLMIDFSEHAAFTADKGTWRFTDRSDGAPWMKGTVTLADPNGSFTVSPFVYFND